MPKNNHSNAPSHNVFVVNDDKDGDQSRWNKVGVMFSHEDGEGFNMLLTTFEKEIRLVARKNEVRNGKSSPKPA